VTWPDARYLQIFRMHAQAAFSRRASARPSRPRPDGLRLVSSHRTEKLLPSRPQIAIVTPPVPSQIQKEEVIPLDGETRMWRFHTTAIACIMAPKEAIR